MGQLYTFFFHWLVPVYPALAEDAAQESFIRAFQNLSGFGSGPFRAWLLRIMTNFIYDLMRQARRHPTRPLVSRDDEGEEIESPAWLSDPGPSVQAFVEQSELSREIHRTLDELPVANRSAITLVDLHELDYREAAQALGILAGTPKSRLARARLQMKQKLEGRRRIEGGFMDVPAMAGRYGSPA